MNDINSKLIKDFKNICVELKNDLQRYHEKISIREEDHDTDFGIENLFEIVVSNLVNEDNYGIVFSLIIKKKKNDDVKNIELSIIRGDGTFINIKDFFIRDNHFEDGSSIEEFNLFIDQFSKEILDVLESEYLK